MRLHYELSEVTIRRNTPNEPCPSNVMIGDRGDDRFSNDILIQDCWLFLNFHTISIKVSYRIGKLLKPIAIEVFIHINPGYYKGYTCSFQCFHCIGYV